LHRTVGGHRGALRGRDRRDGGPDRGVSVARQPVPLHPGQDRPSVTDPMARPLTRVPRVVISGIGIVSPFGVGLKAFWTGLSTGACAIKPATLVETQGFRSCIAAEVPADAMATLPVSRRRSRA